MSELNNHSTQQQANSSERKNLEKQPSIYDDFPIVVDCMGRSWSTTSKLINNDEKQEEGSSFRLLCYNMLCQDYAKIPYFPHLPENTQILNWENRKQRLLDEFLCFSADIICLQEIDRYQDYWRETLLKNGYESTYTQRPNSKLDGCATFWRGEIFEMLHNTSIYCDEIAQQINEMNDQKENNKSWKRFLTSNVANVTILKHRTSEKMICIANVHIYWDVSLSEVQLCQAFYILKKTRDFLNSLSLAHVQTFICGDFNSMPDTALYELLTNGQAFMPECSISFKDDSDFKESLSAAVKCENNNCKQQIFNPFGVCQSLYKVVCGEEPPFTNYTRDFKGCLDYVMACNYPTTIEGKGILVSRALNILTEQQASEFEALPSIKNASDHIALVLDFDIV